MSRDPKQVGALDRRTALKGIGAALGSTLGQACSPAGGGGDASQGSGAEALPTEITPELLASRIDTVVFVMMENRSFDHYFGALSLEEGRPDVDGLDASMSNPHPDGGTVSPYPAEKHCIADPPHSWWSSHEQWNGGKNDGFVSMHHNRHGADEAPRVMGYWGRDTLTTSYALADAHCLCSRWFSSLMTSTWPNRFYALCGTSGGVPNNEIPEASFPSIFDRFDEAGLVWANYYAIAPFAAVLPDSTVSQSGFRALEDFFDGAERGTLPSLSVVDPYYGRNDDHPPCHPVAGQVFLSSIYEALAKSPQWDRVLLVITYDEHGGFFDHVPPPTAPDEYAEEGFDQLGFRVPTLVAGPWVKSGHVSDVVFDHTAILAFCEERWGLEPLAERDAASASLTEVLDLERMVNNVPAAPVELPVIEADDEELYADECTYFPFREDSSLPEQRRGMGQPELEAVLDERFRGTRLDRRDQIDALYEAFLERAEARGLLRRTR